MVRVIEGLIIILIASLTAGAQAATLHGTIYEWADFEKPLKNAIIEVNSTPAQYMVATTGTYSFNLSTGSYLIKAKYYRNNILEYTTEEEIQIDREGVFIHDLLLFPPTDTEYEYLGDINLIGDIDIKSEDDPDNYVIPVLVILLLCALVVLYRVKKKKTISKPAADEPVVPMMQPPEDVTRIKELPEDLHGLYDIILGMGGRTTQKELRKKMAYSEAKVSLMLDDLEERGLIKKIKKGRSNIIITQNQK
ncbi:putative membrane-associated protein/domain [Candidatus Methanoperedens nitroreducens]|uniref:Putative membrane-associated protein/domain n=1 Tax=Candidatus Methanoperedens nitratireducens TaxID=1392998 RepID=A0A062V7N7_9EURY|nr:MarR family transcriptional regulator [Candidatus Methanoperedens nitroreducens]KCZ73312.1 putative membrane-associated protein/domain [Candidatus Methanoperedens nitroreducens]MDJ1422739.1 MarR family transcriptional regulator [Candidatus Methanoperedens sp.]